METPDNLLWINKTHTSRSFSNSHADITLDDRCVRAHVQKWLASRRPKERSKLASSAQSLFGWHQTPDMVRRSTTFDTEAAPTLDNVSSLGCPAETSLGRLDQESSSASQRALAILKIKHKPNDGSLKLITELAGQKVTENGEEEEPSASSRDHPVDHLWSPKFDDSKKITLTSWSGNFNGRGSHVAECGFERLSATPIRMGHSSIRCFDIFPVRLNQRERRLLDIYLNDFIPKFYNAPIGHHLIFNYFRDVSFPLAMTHPITFRCGVLGLAAAAEVRQQLDNGAMQDLDFQNTQSFFWTTRYFQDQDNYASDTAIAICLFRAIFDNLYPDLNSKNAAVTHMRMANQMFEERGRYPAFLMNPNLLVLYYLCNYRVLGYDCQPYRRTQPRLVSGSPWGTSISGMDSVPEHLAQVVKDTTDLCSGFMTFLQKAEHVTADNNTRDPMTVRNKVLAEGSLLHSLLSTEYWSRVETHVISASALSERNPQPDEIRTARHYIDTYGAVILVYLYMFLWEFRGSPGKCERFLLNLNSVMLEAKLDRYPSIDALDQLICCSPALQNIDFDEEHARERHYHTLDTVEVVLTTAKRLSPNNWAKLWTVLTEGLVPVHSMVPHKRRHGPLLTDGEKEQMRNDIVAAPLRCSIAPAFTLTGGTT